MNEKLLREINTNLREAIYSASEALQTGERPFATAAISDCQRALLAAEEGNAEVRQLVQEVAGAIEGNLRARFTL